MRPSSERVDYLLNAYIQNVADENELKELSQLVEQPEGIAEVERAMDHYWSNPILKDADVDSEKVLNRILSHKDFGINKPTRTFILTHKFLRYAALLLVLLGMSVWIFNMRQQNKAQETSQVASSNNLIKSAIQRAVLTLSDGKKIDLQENKVGTISIGEDLMVQQHNGQLIYDGEENDKNKNVLNTMTTPKAGYYRLVLNDGTRVWLNAASSITYPVFFQGSERRVAITGEAYFEVAKDSRKPFYIDANGSEIKVLGTSFNVSAYHDDQYVSTTLVEGLVNIKTKQGSALLKPNQQSIIRRGSNEIKVSNVDTEKAVAWKNGYFMFEDEDIKAVMKAIERWYDIDVVFEGDLRGKIFGGTIARTDDIKSLLKNIELTDAVHFKIDGRRVTVMP